MLKLQPLRDIDFDIWRNKVGTNHKFETDTATPNKENNVTHADKSETTTDNPLSLRDHNEIDYTPILASDMESESETSRKKPKKYRPSASGPSAARQRAHKCSKSSKTPQTTLPQHSYPIRGYKLPNKPPNEAETNPLPVETDCNGTSETSQVEMMADAGHVATPNITVNVQTDNPNKGSLVTCSFELKKYKRPRRFKCKLCGDSSKSVKELNAHHRATHDVEFCDECSKGFSTKSALDKHWYVHRELCFICDRCGMGFPFESQLSQHKITHSTYASLKCMKKNCDKYFKNVSDLNRHVKQHKRSAWFYCDFCGYKNKDKRNTDSHQ